MKRYIKAAARDLHPKKPKLSEAEQFDQMIDEGVSLANEQMPADNPIHRGYGFRHRFNVNNSRTLDDRDFDIGDLRQFKSAREVADALLDKVDNLLDSGLLIYEKDWNDKEDQVRARYEYLLDALNDILAEINEEFKTDLVATVDWKRSFYFDALCATFGLTTAFGYPAKVAPSGHSINVKVGDTEISDYFPDCFLTFRPHHDLFSTPDEFKNAASHYLTELENNIDDWISTKANVKQFESDVESRLTKFVEIHINQYPGLSIDYDIDWRDADRKKVYGHHSLPYVTFQVHCYNDQIAFEMVYDMKEWYETDIEKKIVNAIKYRKRRDRI